MLTATKPMHKNPVSKNGRKTIKDNAPFKLDPEFIAKFTGKKPKFGYNGLGEFVFYRTYSRLKEDGTKETFVDMLQRVVEGCYEIQRMWCSTEKKKDPDYIAFGGMALPWTRSKAQKSAQEMFQRMWDFKFLPPGRGLWVMGTSHMWKLGSASLNNCFAGDTEIITRSGIRKIKDIVGTTQRLLAKGGKWVDSKINSFGVQELIKISIHRGRHRKTIYSTPQHRWFVKSKSHVLATVGGNSESRAYQTRECHTEDLKSGMRLSACFGSGIANTMLRPSVVGIMHGICFGDGTTGSPDTNHGTYLYLCGQKNKELLKYYSECHQTLAPERGSEGAIRVADLPRAFRKAPDLNEAATYLYGWLAGYFAADGKISKAGTCRVSSAERENLEVVRSVCAILGIGCHPICQGLQTVRHNGQIKKFIGYNITLFTDHLTEDFFLLSEHKNRYLNYVATRGLKRRNIPAHMHWYVDSIEYTGQRQEVFCPTVPDYACFTLADNILTGNCGYCSTKDIIEDPAWPFCFVMDMSMLGVGVGFDTRGANKMAVVKPHDIETTFVIEDTRESWVDSLRFLIESFTTNPELGTIRFDYSLIRAAGMPIKGFGGKASGPDTLKDLHKMVRAQFNTILRRKNLFITSVDIVDFMNFIGRCVVAGNVRRSSEIALGDPADWDYMQMKDKTRFSEQLSSHRWASNNSIFATVGMDYRKVATQIADNGEPGCLWLDNVQNYGRTVDGRQEGIDKRATGTNPCAEQSLEDAELCCLCETFPAHHDDVADYHRTLKFAYLYAKTVTLLPTHCKKTNAVLLRNRRIGLSQSGIIQAFAKFGRRQVLTDFCGKGYDVIRHWDEIYSEWLCVSKSLKCTSVKPSGSVSLLAGATAGIHFTIAPTRSYWRNVRVSSESAFLKAVIDAGYHVEPCVTDDKTSIVRFGVSEPAIPSVSEISIWQQTKNAVDYQRYWADNQVSCTIQFSPEEAKDIPYVLEAFDDELKSISFLPYMNHGYPQAPYQPATAEEVAAYNANLKPLDFDRYFLEDAVGTKFCDGDTCQI